MSDHQTPEHSTPIKTPQQLIVVVVLAFVVPVLVIVMLAHLVTGGKKAAPATAASEEAVAKRIKPAGEVVVKAADGASEKRSGKAVYESVCMACHGTGALNAPKFGDKAAWAPRIATGVDTLHANAIKGKNAMPPRGGTTASDAAVRGAVDFMVNAAK